MGSISTVQQPAPEIGVDDGFDTMTISQSVVEMLVQMLVTSVLHIALVF